jgi:hypothetical protein
LPQLTSLECGGDAWQHYLGDAPFAGQLKRLTLVEGYTHEPDKIALNSSNLSGLRELHLQRWRNNHTWPNQLAPLQSMEKCFAADLLVLQRLTLDDVAGIDFVLAALPHLPLLNCLRMLVPFEEKPRPPSAPPSSAASSVPSLQALRALLDRCPKIDCHLSVASRCVSVYSSGPCVMNLDELLPSIRLCALRDGCSHLPRTTVEFLVADD